MISAALEHKEITIWFVLAIECWQSISSWISNLRRSVGIQGSLPRRYQLLPDLCLKMSQLFAPLTKLSSNVIHKRVGHPTQNLSNN